MANSQTRRLFRSKTSRPLTNEKAKRPARANAPAIPFVMTARTSPAAEIANQPIRIVLRRSTDTQNART